MPTTTIHREVTAQQAATALQNRLGPSYLITCRNRDTLTVKHGALTTARVRLHWADDATAFHVHGLGLAGTVAGALEQSFPPAGLPDLVG